MDRLDVWTAWEHLDSEQVWQMLCLRNTGLHDNLDRDTYKHDRLMGHLEVVASLADPELDFPDFILRKDIAAVVKETIRLLSRPKNAISTASDGLQSSPLARLPPELRELIYAEALPDSARLEYCVVPVNFHGGTDTAALLRVCKQMRQEAAKFLYGRNDLVFLPGKWPSQTRHHGPRLIPSRRARLSPAPETPLLHPGRYRFNYWVRAATPLVSRCVQSIVIYDTCSFQRTQTDFEQLYKLKARHPKWKISYSYPAVETMGSWLLGSSADADNYPAKIDLDDMLLSISTAKRKIDDVASSMSFQSSGVTGVRYVYGDASLMTEDEWRRKFNIYGLEGIIMPLITQMATLGDEGEQKSAPRRSSRLKK